MATTSATPPGLPHSRNSIAMLEDHHLYKAAIEHSPIGIGLCAPEGRFLDVNRALCTLTGHEAQALRARDLFDLCHPDHTERTRDGVEALLKMGAHRHGDAHRAKYERDEAHEREDAGGVV